MTSNKDLFLEEREQDLFQQLGTILKPLNMDTLVIKEIKAQKIDKKSNTENAGLIKQLVDEGTLNPIEALVKMQSMIDMLTQAKELIIENALTEIQKEGKEAKFEGAKLEIREVGAKYIFDNCNYPGYSALKDIKETTEREMKEIEATLKTLRTTTGIVSNDGESFEVHPPVKSSKTSIVITLPKE